MLGHINAEREKAGVAPVILGDNIAAQLHADASLENCFASHWGIDGLKPYMRYSLAGGYQSNGENALGIDYCVTGSDGYRAIPGMSKELNDAVDGLMSSPGHRRNILYPWHKKVNIGLAWDRYNISAVQHFEGDYVEYKELPVIENGILAISGTVKHGVTFEEESDLGVQIYYDPPPYTLTRGQVSRTYCYDSGRQVAGLRPPSRGNSYYTEDEFTKGYSPCPNPYDVPADAPAPRSPDEAHQFWQAAYDASQAREEIVIRVPWITALEWTATGNEFSVRADLDRLLSKHGNGVYSVAVWGIIKGEDVVISDYSIFHGITHPDTYSPTEVQSEE